ncbi:MAG TPA: carbohydrate kinase family protein [Acidimicrobiia bacterium]
MTSQRHDLVVLGDVNPDVILRGAPETLTFGQAEREVASATLTLGGSGALMAHAAARLGLRTAFVGLVGVDRAADVVLAILTDAGVDISGVVRDPDIATPMTVVFVRPDGDRAILTAPGALTSFGPEHIDERLLLQTRHVHVASVFLQPRLMTALPRLLTSARNAGAVTSLDTNDDPARRWIVERSLFAAVDYLLPNEREVVALAFGPSSTADAVTAAQALAAQGPVVVVKCGAAGAFAVHSDADRMRVERARLPPSATAPLAMVDTVGAGDCFDAGLVAGLVHGLPAPGALQLAVATGTLSVRSAGGSDGQPSAAEATRLAARVIVENEE